MKTTADYAQELEQAAGSSSAAGWLLHSLLAAVKRCGYDQVLLDLIQMAPRGGESEAVPPDAFVAQFRERLAAATAEGRTGRVAPLVALFEIVPDKQAVLDLAGRTLPRATLYRLRAALKDVWQVDPPGESKGQDGTKGG